VPLVGALTFASLNGTMAIGRFLACAAASPLGSRDDFAAFDISTCGVVIQRYGRAPVLRAAGVLACTGVGRVE
jgi:hypothetical protein